LFASLVKAGAPPRILDGGIEFEFIEPIGAGDILTATSKIAKVTERETKLGKTMFTTAEVTYVNEKGNEVLRTWATIIQF
jgi:acyl dehydratase